MSEKTPTRGGLNASEATIAWAYAHLGGDREALDLLDADAAADLRAAVDPLEELAQNERLNLAERWRREDRRWESREELVATLDAATVERERAQMAPHWRRVVDQVLDKRRRVRAAPHNVRVRRAVVAIALGFVRPAASTYRTDLRDESGFDPALLVDMEAAERRCFVRRLGVFELSELAQRQDRRQVVRLHRSLPVEDRPFFNACMKRNRDTERLERGRLREVFLSASRREQDLGRRLLHLGAYVIAAGAGVRFAARLDAVAARIGGDLGDLLRHYHLRDAEAGLPHLEAAFRRSLDAYVAHLDASTSSTPATDPRGVQ
ncbi:MAG: hypothetical protein ACOCV2_11235 [Persicimonas sp.]